ncbi:hypothetical protein HK102_007591 [Quaeritorhiza haematococci]|nr:hypothetical protein HK102_007591 [Quaeritorhiza haematococci]
MADRNNRSVVFNEPHVNSPGEPNFHEEYADREPLVSHLVKALRIADEWALMQKLDLSERNIMSLYELEEHAPNLKELKLDHNKITYLTGVPQSTTVLRVAHNRLSNLTSFAMLKNLHCLDISHNALTDISAVSCLMHLRELHAAHNSIDSVHLSADIESLTTLNLQNNNIRRIDFGKGKLAHLKTLNLACNHLESLENIEHLASLEELILDNNRIKAIRLVGNLTRLEKLSANDNMLASIDTRRFPHLRALYVRRNRLGRSGRRKSVMLQQRHSQSVLEPSLSAAVAAAPQESFVECVDVSVFSDGNALQDLEVLHMESQKTGDMMHIDFSLFPNLREVNISENHFPSLHIFRDNARLETLVARGCKVIDLPRSFARGVPVLRVLDLTDNSVQDVHFIKHLKKLKVLQFSSNDIRDFSALLKTIRSCGELEVLDLRYNPVTARSYAPMPESSYVNPPLLFWSTYISRSTLERSAKVRNAGVDGSSLSLDHQHPAFESNSAIRWMQSDSEYSRSLSDSDFVRRLCYRSSLISALRASLVVLDGVLVKDEDRRLSHIHIQRLKEVGKRNMENSFVMGVPRTHSSRQKSASINISPPKHAQTHQMKWPGEEPVRDEDCPPKSLGRTAHESHVHHDTKMNLFDGMDQWSSINANATMTTTSRNEKASDSIIGVFSFGASAVEGSQLPMHFEGVSRSKSPVIPPAADQINSGEGQAPVNRESTQDRRNIRKTRSLIPRLSPNNPNSGGKEIGGPKQKHQQSSELEKTAKAGAPQELPPSIQSDNIDELPADKCIGDGDSSSQSLFKGWKPVSYPLPMNPKTGSAASTPSFPKCSTTTPRGNSTGPTTQGFSGRNQTNSAGRGATHGTTPQEAFGSARKSNHTADQSPQSVSSLSRTSSFHQPTQEFFVEVPSPHRL